MSSDGLEATSGRSRLRGPGGDEQGRAFLKSGFAASFREFPVPFSTKDVQFQLWTCSGLVLAHSLAV